MTHSVVVAAREVHDVDVLNGRHVAVLALLEEQRHVLRHRLEVERQLRRRHEVLAIRVVPCERHFGNYSLCVLTSHICDAVL